MNSRPHTKCRICRSESLVPGFDLGTQPLANGFYEPGSQPPPRFPLNVKVCGSCGLAQLSEVVDPKVLYSFYRYVTSPSRTMRDHFDNLWDRACSVLGRIPSSVLEIGSNDGRLLAAWKPRLKKVFGVDPAKNLTEKASADGIPTLAAPFCEATSRHIAGQDSPPDVIVARHVLCHIDDWWDAFAGLNMVAGPDTVIMIEVPDASRLLENGEFDTIYHEHLSYVTPEDLRFFLRILGEETGIHFRIADQWQVGLHGGSVVLSIVRGRDPIGALRNTEASISDWAKLDWFASERCFWIRSSLEEYAQASVVGYGCPAKSTVLLSKLGGAFGIQYITDTTPEKQGLLHPVGGIPIVHPDVLAANPPDLAVLFAWNFRREILEKEAQLRSRGTRFLIPLPNLIIK